MRIGTIALLLLLPAGLIRTADPEPATEAVIYEFDFDFIMRMGAKWRGDKPADAARNARIHPRGLIEWNGLRLDPGDEIVHRRIGKRDFLLFRGSPEKHQTLDAIYRDYMGKRLIPAPRKLLEVLDAAEAAKG